MSPAEIIASAEVALFPPYDRERRRQTDDGRIWPFSRAAMRNGQAIRERLAEDFLFLLRERGQHAVITTDDLLSMGWSRDQLSRHVHAALDLAKGQTPHGNERGRDLTNEVA